MKLIKKKKKINITSKSKCAFELASLLKACKITYKIIEIFKKLYIL